MLCDDTLTVCVCVWTGDVMWNINNICHTLRSYTHVSVCVRLCACMIEFNICGGSDYAPISSHTRSFYTLQKCQTPKVCVHMRTNKFTPFFQII